ncbi:MULTISPECIES: glycosyltransferase family 4 protein [Sorangium]|uniref:glycosyltransferase family 4 protein n=1 Tax=Sorangium TaxID=39643 RepID=UPI003D9C4F8C
MPERRFLLISYFYPPHGGAGVQRALHLSRIAPSLGWAPVVLASGQRGRTAVDRSLLSKVPEGVRVERTRAAVGFGTLFGALPVDAYLGWLPFALRRLSAILREERFDLVFSTSAPFTAHLLGDHARRALGVPWVADFRDPWTDNNFLPLYRGEGPIARMRQRVDRRIEERVFAGADAVLVTADPFRSLLVERRGLPEGKVHLVRNGFDAEDFAAPYAPRPDPGGRFRLLFAGNMYGDYNLASVFRAADRLLSRRALPGFELSIVSAAGAWAEREAKKYPHLRPHLRVEKPVPHDQIVARYRDADALVLCALDPLSTPGKLYEYIAAGPPVIAFVVPGTDAALVLSRTGAGEAVPADDVELGALSLERAYDRFRRGELPARREDEIAKLTRQAQVAEIVALFERLAGERGAASPRR